MTILQSMIDNLTLPYDQGAYVQELSLAHKTEDGKTSIPQYSLEDYASRHGIPPWELKPVYLVAPRFDLGEEYICLTFQIMGSEQAQTRIPAHTPAGTSFIIPLDKTTTGLTRLTELHEFPVSEAPGHTRWQILVLLGNLGRLLWVLGWERAYLGAAAHNMAVQRHLAKAHGYSLDLIGQELQVPRLLPTPYSTDPETIALYHFNFIPDDIYDLTNVGSRVIDMTGRHHGTNEGAERGVQGRFDHAFAFRSGDLPRPKCATEHEFQERLRSGDWDAYAGEREVREGPYRRYGYREGAIEVNAPDDNPHAVWVNDEAESPQLRGQLTSACYGFVPDDLDRTIERLQNQNRSVQEAIDYFGNWWGRPSDWFANIYEEYGIEAPYARCPYEEMPLTYVRIPNRTAFNIPAGQSFTVEAFIRPVPTEDDRLRIIAIKSHEIFYSGPMSAHCVEGWALSMGTFNCIPNNVAWSISDLPDIDEETRGQRAVTVTADLNLDDGQWHHIAGVVDRRYQVIRLYVDGVERGCTNIRQVGAIINQEDILLGINDYHFDAPYDGAIDEVRFSRVARRDFRPVLGESDARYRTRLSIYRPWIIPTHGNLRDGLQRLLEGTSHAPEIDLIEQDSIRLCTEHLLNIRPLSVLPGAHIDLEGDARTSEAAVCGPTDATFFEWQLLSHDHPALEYETPNARRMQLATARSLDRLAQLLKDWMAQTDQKLQVLGAYEPGADPRRSVGRALLLHMPEMPGNVLAAFAHKACFDYVRNDGAGRVRAAVREETDKLEIVTQDEAGDRRWPGRETNITSTVDTPPLHLTVVRPDLPDPRYLTWQLIECGPGRGRLEPANDNTSRMFTARAPGRIIVQVEYTWQGEIFIGRREIKIGLETLPPCESIGADGALGVSQAEAAGTPERFFHEALLLEHNDPQGRVDYGDNLNHRKLQLGTEKALYRLLALIDQAPGVSGKLRILDCYDPAADDLAQVGRKLKLVHEDTEQMHLGRLAALAHDAGFAWVHHPPYPNGIFVATGPEPQLEIMVGPVAHLPPNAAINWLGIMSADVPEAPVSPGVDFDATDPNNHHDDPDRVTYAHVRAHLMTPAAQAKLNALLDRLANETSDGTLHILGAFEDAAPNRRRAGAALQMQHSTLSLKKLGALAHQAGFDYVKHVTLPSDPAQRYIYASVWRNEDLHGKLAEIVDYGLIDPGSFDEVAVGAVRRLCLRPDVLAWSPPAPDPNIDPNADDEPEPLPDAAHYYWCVTRYGPGQARLDTPVAQACQWLTAKEPGMVGARGEFVLGDGTKPYRFALVARPGSQGRIAPIPKQVYDDLMNFLEFRHPVGVEVRTLSLREHVPELMANRRLHNANTERTYPRYRQRKKPPTKPTPQSGESTPARTCACSPPRGEDD